MNEPILLLVIGFVLTSVLGGALAYLFQQRAWRHQYETERRDQQRQLALKTFEEVSALLDQRLYRSQVLDVLKLPVSREFALALIDDKKLDAARSTARDLKASALSTLLLAFTIISLTIAVTSFLRQFI